MKAYKQILAALLCCSFALLSACSRQTGQDYAAIAARLAATEHEERIPDESLAALREQYPEVDNTHPTAFMDYSRWETLEDMRVLTNYAVAVIEPTGEIQTKTASMYPYDDPEANAAVGSIEMSANYCTAVVRQILYGGGDLEVGSEFQLLFQAYTKEANSVFREGQLYVCFLDDARDLIYNIENSFAANVNWTFYVTDECALISVSDDVPCIRDCSGMYLDTFTTELNEALGTPDVVSPQVG